MRKHLFFIGVIMLCYACNGDTIPKPKPYLKLEYPVATYKGIITNCPYSFEISDKAVFKPISNCWASIEYPDLNATIHITYRPVKNNLSEILTEVEKLTFEHTVKANAIEARPFVNIKDQIFGKIYYVEGNVATNIQFRATDSSKHVLSGALYFYTRPNYDSILPAIRHIEKDMTHIMETLRWNSNENHE